MTKFVFTIQEPNLEVLAHGIISADTRKHAEREVQKMVAAFTEVGYKVGPTSLASVTIQTAYAPDRDMTFIIRETADEHQLFCTEVIGFYQGQPNEDETNLCMGRLIAEY